MKPGEGAGRFLGDLANGETDEVMRERWAAGHYGTDKLAPRAEYVKAWRAMAGR